MAADDSAALKTANGSSPHFSFDADADPDKQKECRTTANISERRERLAKPRATRAKWETAPGPAGGRESNSAQRM